MPPKKKEKDSSNPKPVRKTSTPKPVKKTAKKITTTKKADVKKPSTKAKAKTLPKSDRIKKEDLVSKKAQSLDVSDAVPVTTREFKSLPRHGETQIVAFIRDPQCVFTYWEVTPERMEEVQRELKEEFKDSHMVLRLYTVGANGERILVDEIRVEPSQINRYVELSQTGGSYVLEIGQKTGTGRYMTYAQSNPIHTMVQPYTGSSLDVQDPISAGEVSQEMLDYFYDQGYDPDSPPLTEFISSAENEKRLKRKREHYKASFF
jgi:hypothetical protein